MTNQNEKDLITVPGTSFTIEPMSKLPDGTNPASEDVDWFHTYTIVNKDVYVFDFGREGGTEYIIVAHRPSGRRFKIRFTTNVFQFEGMAHVPRSILDSNLERAKATRSRELDRVVESDLRIVDGVEGEKLISAGAFSNFDLYDANGAKLTDDQVNEAITKMEEGIDEPQDPSPSEDQEPIIPEADVVIEISDSPEPVLEEEK